MSLLIVAHGGVNRILLANAIHVGLGAFGRFEQDPCCLNILDISSDGSAIIRLVNATPYNQVKEGLTLTTMERLYQQYRAGRA
jgi:probable phosphoglycerate mutase